jgi:hypothetical protein
VAYKQAAQAVAAAAAAAEPARQPLGV